MTAGMEAEWTWQPEQLHAGLFGRPIPLLVVAAVAARDQILPGCLASARARNDMIQGHFTRGQRFVTVLACIAIAHQNILARERARLVWDAAIFK